MDEQRDFVRAGHEDGDGAEIDLMDLFMYYRGHWAWLLAGAVAGALILGLVTRYAVTPKYTSSAKVYMVSASSDKVVDLTDLNIGTSLSADYVELLKIRPIFEEIIREQGLPYDYGELLGMTGFTVINDTRLLTITVESADAGESMRVANALADKAVTYLPKVMEVSAPNVAERAVMPEGPSSPDIVRNTLAGGAGALALVLAVMTFLYVTDDTLQSAEDVEKAFGVMPLTVMPEADIESLSDKAEREAGGRKGKARGGWKEKSRGGGRKKARGDTEKGGGGR